MTSVRVTFLVAIATIIVGLGSPASAQQPWSSMPAACAPTDNNFYSGTPSTSYPVARFIVPGGAFTFNQAVYGRLYRALAIWGLRPALYQVRLQAAPIITQPTTATDSEPQP